MISEPAMTQQAVAGAGSFSAFRMCWESEIFSAAKVPRKPPGPLWNQMLQSRVFITSLVFFLFLFPTNLFGLVLLLDNYDFHIYIFFSNLAALFLGSYLRLLLFFKTYCVLICIFAFQNKQTMIFLTVYHSSNIFLNRYNFLRHARISFTIWILFKDPI